MLKQNKVKIIFFVLIAFILLGLVISSLIEDKKEARELSELKEMEENALVVNYAEGDEDLTYNYIANPQALQGLELSVDVVTTLNDEINNQLQANSITGEAVMVNDIQTQDSKTVITLITENSNKKVNVTYDKASFEMTVIVEM